MEDLSKIGSFALLGDADLVPQSLFLSHPEQANTLTLLYEVSREITSILDREELLRRVAERIKKIVKYHVFSVMLWNEQTQHLETAFAMCCGDSLPLRMRVPLNIGLTGTAAGERRVLRINDVTDDSRYIRCESGVTVRSELVVPLLLRDRLIGVLDLESSEPHAFTLEHERMLSTLGSYIAVALENARLYQEARQSEQRMRSELDTAREIQRQLLPTGAREVPGLDLAAGYVPARELGGDFYDFLPYGRGRLGFMLGDVSGKGTAAALYGSLAIGTVREIVVDHACEPAGMLALLNQRLVAARLDSRFIAMLFAVYEASTRKLTLANAGGPYPLLVRKGEVQAIRLEGVPLGLIPDTQYDETTIDLEPGDVVLFASDGILESENAAQEEFGPERLKEILSAISQWDSAQAITEQILAATDGHSGAGLAPHDDRTLVVLRVTNETASDFSKLPIIY
ncbi:MAG: serine/threonine protein phosphatase [Acidobacteria bacterium]|nr:MAG: serine/threonine protein phosphatase [Acidobacteriota bacterium]PYU72715.1 MAG: serine/threonine protein phosphatase [Acidobacteriota bacterium]